MKRITLALLTLAMGISLLHAAAFEKRAKYRTLKVLITSDKPLAVGNNRLHLKVIKSAQPLDRAKVALKIFMPAMPGMPYMESKAIAKPVGTGTYDATVNLPMAGTWQVHIFVTTKEGKKYRVKSSLNL